MREQLENGYIWPRRFWFWIALVPLGAIALFLIYVDGVVLASLAFETVRTPGLQVLFVAYVVGAVIAPLLVLRRMKSRGAASACLWAAALSVAVSVLVLPVVTSAFIM